jgi:lipopolysaccharide biosynthesis glycosyltransferase
MNIMYCGDSNILDGLIISVLSLIKNTKEELHIYVLTMKYENEYQKYKPLDNNSIEHIDNLLKKENKNSFIKLIDVTDLVNEYPPRANIKTRFTPYCMLRLYADLVEEMPSRVLYLDTDVVCLKDPKELYEMDIDKYELVGVLDYYGSHFYRKNIYKKDYINSGVLLMNMYLIKENKLFLKARRRCKWVKMLLPDQTALNLLCRRKKIIPRKYNEQRKIKEDTVFRHFTTIFKTWPTIHTQTIKPWDIEKLHEVLKVHEIDDILEQYLKVKEKLNDK